MCSSDVAIRVENLGKRYEIYATPQDRLKQFIIPRMQGIVGKNKAQYFQEFWALRDVSFEVKRGEAFGIVGRNGSGKSTLLQLVTGNLSPTTGTVFTQGRIAALLELGSGFNPDFTGRENVYLNGILIGMSREQVDARFDDIAAFADIGNYIDQPVKTYSSGMVVRLAFSVQVHVQPDILIVDEALAVGDALFQKRCYERLDKLLSDGLTLLFVSHDQESVRTLTRRALFLKQGRPVVCGLSSDVILTYRKFLHDEESAYFDSITQKIVESKKNRVVEPSPSDKVSVACVTNNGVEKADALAECSPRLSFGDGGINVMGVQTLSADGKACSIFYPGDYLGIRVTCLSEIDTDKINVSIRIRNKEGVKIYSWGTLNQDMQIIAGLKAHSIFWQRQIHAGERFEVCLECECTVGPNLYEIQAAVSYENTPDYSSQRLLHWVDEAAFFQVMMRQKEYFFGGIVDLRMEAKW